MKEEMELHDCIIPGISRMFVGLIYLIFYQLGTTYIPNQYLLSAEFREQTFLKRLFTIGFWGHFNLYKYISCWLLAEGVRKHVYIYVYNIYFFRFKHLKRLLR